MFKCYNPCYYYENINYLMKLENQYEIKMRSPQFQYRSCVIKFIFDCCEHLSLTRATIHLAVRLVDLFMDSHCIKVDDRLLPVALTCVWIASKFEEIESNIPKIESILKILKNNNTKSEIFCIENLILKFFNFGVQIPTIFQFSEYFYPFCIITTDKYPLTKNYEEVTKAVNNTFRSYIDSTLFQSHLLLYKCSMLSAACLLAARIKHNILPNWSPFLIKSTRYQLDELETCCQLIMKETNNCNNENNPKKALKRKLDDDDDDLGYASASPEKIFSNRKEL